MMYVNNKIIIIIKCQQTLVCIFRKKSTSFVFCVKGHIFCSQDISLLNICDPPCENVPPRSFSTIIFHVI